MRLQFKKVCQRCGGSGRKIVPLIRRIMFKTCSHCGGKGVRFEVLELPGATVSK